MPCKICGRCACAEWMHSAQEQKEFDTKTGRYAPKKEEDEEEADD